MVPEVPESCPEEKPEAAISCLQHITIHRTRRDAIEARDEGGQKNPGRGARGSAHRQAARALGTAGGQGATASSRVMCPCDVM